MAKVAQSAGEEQLSLRVRFTRISPERHVFEAVRADGTSERRELETRSFLLHDLVHYAVEIEAGTRDGFYGRLAAGLPDGEMTPEAAQIEGIVGPMQSSAGQAEPGSPEDFVAALTAYFAQSGRQAPAWFTPEFVARARERLRRLLGQWRATAFGAAMELEFPG